MKRIVIMLGLLTGVSAMAASLVWDDPNPPGIVKSFRVWLEEASGSWTNIATVQTNRWLIVLPAGAHRIAVSAVGGTNSLESSRSPFKALDVLINPTIPRIEQ